MIGLRMTAKQYGRQQQPLPPSLPLILQRDSQGTQGGVTQENSREHAFGRSVSPISLLLAIQQATWPENLSA